MDKSDQEIILEYSRYSMYITRVIFHSNGKRKKEIERENRFQREKIYFFIYVIRKYQRYGHIRENTNRPWQRYREIPH